MENKLSSLIGSNFEENFLDFDLTEIQTVLADLKNENPIDLAHAESMQQKTLRGADVCAEFLGKLQKTTSYLETKINTLKNKIAMEYEPKDSTVKVTMDMRKFAAESHPDVEDLQVRLAKAKGSKLVLEKKYELLIKQHHFLKEISMGLRKTF